MPAWIRRSVSAVILFYREAKLGTIGTTFGIKTAPEFGQKLVAGDNDSNLSLVESVDHRVVAEIGVN